MLFALILSLSLLADPAITGVVKDSAGGAIVGAAVVVQSSAGEEQTYTGPDGRFAIDAAPQGTATIIVRAAGFAEKKETLSGSHDIEVVLAPAEVLENVTVTPGRTEQKLGDVAASVNILDATDVRQSPAVVADDVLRQIPTFSLFTRASSLSSHPTSQGVSLRGIGPSGVSRTLVMADGVPANDPFGGWVYWTRFPTESIDRVEVVDGPSSSLYGNYAMGGVINILSQPPSRRTIELKPQYGNLSSPKLDYFGSDVWGKVGIAVDGAAYDTDGFPIVAEAERGAVDNNASVQFNNTNVKLDYHPSSRIATFMRAGYFHEARNNGKQSTFDGTEEHNHTQVGYVSGTAKLDLPHGNALEATAFGNDEHFFSNFLAVPAATPPRSIGRMSLNQTVPTHDAGGMGQWTRLFGSMNFVSVGGDFHYVTGESQEDSLDPTKGLTVVLHRVSGGSQQSGGLYAQDIITPFSNLTITVAVRYDHFHNYDGHNLENSVSNGVIGPPTVNNNPALPNRTDNVGTPRAAVNYRANERLSLWGDVNTGFRAPTLNELYRQFKKGTTTTLANYSLVPETLTGGELGVTYSAPHDMTFRLTGFDNHVTNPVTNVTILTPITPITLPTASATCIPSASNICQQRQNVGKTEIIGFQTAVDWRYKNVTATAAYLYEQATVKENAANTAVVGNFLPEVPENRGSVQVAYVEPRLATLAVDVQVIGAQFDDDLNTPSRLMPAYSVTNFSAARTILKGLDVYFGMQNAFNKTFVVATLPTTIGAPRLYNVGVRIRWTGK